MDLQKVKDLLDLGTEFASKEGKVEVKIKLRKGCPTKKLAPPELTQEEDYRSILSTAAFPLEPVDTVKEWALAASPKLKPKPQSWLSSLAHKADCDCPCCSDPRLARVVVRWAAAQAELAHQLEQEGGERQSSKLFLAALSSCKTLTAKLRLKLASLMLENDFSTKEVPSPSFVHDLVGKIYLRMSLASLELHLEKTERTWELLESGLTFVASKHSPELVPLRAHLQTTKALASILILAANKDCRAADLFSAAWSWNLAAKCETKPKRLRSTKTIKQCGEILAIQDTKKCKDPAASLPMPKVKITFPSTKSKFSKKKTVIKSSKLKSAAVEVPCGFDFDDEVPQISVRTHSPGAACTPNQKLKGAPRARQGEAKPRPKLHFQVYDESSPVQNKPGPVPAAPKRSKRSRFKVEFSDDSDAETSTQEALGAIWPLSKTSCASKARSEKMCLKKTGRTKKSTTLPSPSSSSVEEDIISNASIRRGRTKKQSMPSTTARGVSTSKEEPERMRAIKEDMDSSMDMSVEELRASDLEEEEKDVRARSTAKSQKRDVVRARASSDHLLPEQLASSMHRDHARERESGRTQTTNGGLRMSQTQILKCLEGICGYTRRWSTLVNSAEWTTLAPCPSPQYTPAQGQTGCHWTQCDVSCLVPGCPSSTSPHPDSTPSFVASWRCVTDRPTL
ncbi:hypothetical protein MATL_G00068670 [Megalops atlanticus]|uniref:Uncharacterized protein n=1 Tax=Megalops atlanticus TaxID=7932 RepID=A0A9D3Q5S1_MEGAT|nr:hypothetical protein MATL_G00068670 [Megalops atlanticus]